MKSTDRSRRWFYVKREVREEGLGLGRFVRKQSCRVLGPKKNDLLRQFQYCFHVFSRNAICDPQNSKSPKKNSEKIDTVGLFSLKERKETFLFFYLQVPTIDGPFSRLVHSAQDNNTRSKHHHITFKLFLSPCLLKPSMALLGPLSWRRTVSSNKIIQKCRPFECYHMVAIH